MTRMYSVMIAGPQQFLRAGPGVGAAVHALFGVGMQRELERDLVNEHAAAAPTGLEVLELARSVGPPGPRFLPRRARARTMSWGAPSVASGRTGGIGSASRPCRSRWVTAVFAATVVPAVAAAQQRLGRSRPPRPHPHRGRRRLTSAPAGSWYGKFWSGAGALRTIELTFGDAAGALCGGVP